MDRTAGEPFITVGVIDGPVSLDKSVISGGAIREIQGGPPLACRYPGSIECVHGTLVTGMLAAKRTSAAPGICPGCSFIVRPIFPERSNEGSYTGPIATPGDLGAALIDSINAGANIINLSAALALPSSRGEQQLEQALDYAARRGVLVVTAAGNQGVVGGSAVTRHPWVIPVIACNIQGGPTSESNLGNSIGRCGLMAPGENISGFGTDGAPATFSGTSAATPFVTGAIALLWSEFPRASAAQIRLAVTHGAGTTRNTITPPMLNAWAAYLRLKQH
jgi:subtilisin family serine protease